MTGTSPSWKNALRGRRRALDSDSDNGASPMTLREALVAELRTVASRHGPEEAPPVAALWTDRDGVWKPAIGALKAEMPGLLSLGPYDAASRIGPAVWIRCAVAGTLEPALPASHIAYLPGVARAALRETPACPRELQPLVELQYRG